MYKPKNGKVVVEATKEKIEEMKTASGIFTSADDTPKIKYDGTATITHAHPDSDYEPGDKILFNAKKTDFLCIPDSELMTMSERDIELVYDSEEKEILDDILTKEDYEEYLETIDHQGFLMKELIDRFRRWNTDWEMHERTHATVLLTDPPIKKVEPKTMNDFADELTETYKIIKKEN